MNIFIAYDAVNGQGHKVRCEALAYELRLRGHLVTMDDTAPAHIVSWDISEIPGVIFDNDIVIIDDYRLTFSKYPALDENPFLVIIDDGYDREIPEWIDLVVNGGLNLFTPKQSYGAKHLIGPRYALLRREFTIAHAGHEASEAGHTSKHLDGTINWDRLVFDAIVAENLSAAQMIDAFSTSMITKCAPGMRLLEALCVGATNIELDDSHACPQNQPNIDGFCVIPRGYFAGRRGVMLYLSVDGRGCIRAADEIERLYEHKIGGIS